MGINLGRYCIGGSLFLAPMAGVTDAPFRRLCREFGADYAVGEMVTSAPQLRNSRKTLARVKFFDAEEPRAVQLLGADPAALKDAFYWACEAGAQVVDFNMGCPAKKVCNVACGSALMKEESLALEILSALGEVSKECEVPVTLKCRTGWDEAHKNALTFARAAQKAGFCMVTVHGRTRDMFYSGKSDREIIKKVKESVSIPVIANGDVTDRDSYLRTLEETGADGVAVARAAMGRPYIFSELRGEYPDIDRGALIAEHFSIISAVMPEKVAVNCMKKHIAAYAYGLRGGKDLKLRAFAASCADDILKVAEAFSRLYSESMV